MFKFVKKLRRDEEGATAIEYGLIAALIAVALIGALNTLSGDLSTKFESIGDSVESAGANSGDSGDSGDSGSSD